MKIIFRLVLIALTATITSCLDLPDREVATVYLNSGSRDYQRNVAVVNLYQHYSQSDKSESFYEIISKKNGRFILNYYPKGELLTLSDDPGSGWSRQYKVSGALFEKLVRYHLTLDDIGGSAQKNYDSILVENKPRFRVKTNGNP